jgi:selenide,water dikinase
MGAIPLLDGALETVEAGILSSLQPQNLRLRRAIRDVEQASKHPAFPLLFDPQTAGGLLAGVPDAHANACIDELHVMGYPDAVIIGRIEPLSDQQAPIRIS